MVRAALGSVGDVNLDLPLKHWDLFVEGIWMTLHLTALALFFGALIAIPIAFAMLRGGAVGWFAQGYVYVFRGTPLLVQTYLIYYGVSQFEVIRETWFWRAPVELRKACINIDWTLAQIDTMRDLWFTPHVDRILKWKICAGDFIPSLRSAWWCALIAFSLNSGAYVAEILRGALKNTPKGELEAARAMGLSEKQVRKLIHLPSAFRRALPQYGNEVIFMLHGSAVASTITIQDILGAGYTLNGKYYVAYEGFLTAAFLYLCITYMLVFLFRLIERRYLKHLNVGEPIAKRGWFGRSLSAKDPQTAR